MQETTNLKLKKPDLNDYVNVTDLNGNADLIDVAVTENKDDLATHLADDVAHNRYGTASGTNAKTITLDPAPTALIAGMSLRFKNTTANTGAVTLNINDLGAKSIVKNGGTALSSGNLKAGGVYTVAYDGTSFILQGEGGEYGTAGAPDVLVGKTIGTENGLVAGSFTSIKSIQSGYIDFATGETNKSVSITSVDPNKAVVEITYTTNGDALNNTTFRAVILVNAFVNIIRVAGGGTARVYWRVIEFNNVKSIQSGLQGFTGSTTIPISTVNANKSLLYWSWAGNSSSSNLTWSKMGVVLGASSISVDQGGLSVNGLMNWQVIEFY